MSGKSPSLNKTIKIYATTTRHEWRSPVTPTVGSLPKVQAQSRSDGKRRKHDHQEGGDLRRRLLAHTSKLLPLHARPSLQPAQAAPGRAERLDRVEGVCARLVVRVRLGAGDVEVGALEVGLRLRVELVVLELRGHGARDGGSNDSSSGVSRGSWTVVFVLRKARFVEANRMATPLGRSGHLQR
jgi:hypothetical protein